MTGMPSERPTTSTRDVATVVHALAVWLQRVLPSDELPDIEVLGGPGGAGFSSETVLFDVSFRRGGEPQLGRYVLRLPPPRDAFPLFPRYDLVRQATVMRLVRERSQVPVPAVPWFVEDEAVLGEPFLVMERVDGIAVSDVPPYVFGGWLADATKADRDRVEAGMVRVLAGIHGVELTPEEADALELGAPGETPLRRHVANQWAYYEWIRAEAGTRFPLVERAFEKLDATWPEEGPAVVSWGDARLANVLFRDFEPVAVLDWESAAIAPREVDLGWCIFFHQYFQRVAERFGYPGIPDFFERDRVVAAYEEASGQRVRDLDWYLLYAELRQALTSIRVTSRAVHFGERDEPDDPQDLIIDRDHLEEVVQ